MALQRRFSIIALAFFLIATALPAQTVTKKGGKKGKKKAAAAAQHNAAEPKATPTPVPRLEKIQPYLTFKGDPASSIVINWWNPDAAGDSTVLYGPTAAYGATAEDKTTQTHFHHVELTGLTPGATYHYQIRSSDGTVGEDNTFTLPAKDLTGFTFAVCGDSRNGGKGQDWTLYNPRRKAQYDHIASKKPAFVINVGDLVSRGTNPGDWVFFFNCEQNAIKRAPYLVAMGNHEISGSGAWPRDFLYYNLFSPAYPANGTPGDSGQPTALGMNYSYDWGNAHFVFLSSFKMSPESQVEWLDRDLAAARSNPKIKWIFASMHSPLYTWSKGHKADEKALAAWGPVLDKHHVDLVFAGHNHLYERSHVIKGGEIVETGNPAQGTIYMTCGLGGAPFAQPSPADPKYPFILKSYNEQTAAAYIQINGDKLEMKFLTARDELIDSFTIDKSAAKQ